MPQAPQDVLSPPTHLLDLPLSPTPPLISSAIPALASISHSTRELRELYFVQVLLIVRSYVTTRLEAKVRPIRM